MAIAHVGPITITIQQDMPSSWVKTGKPRVSPFGSIYLTLSQDQALGWLKNSYDASTENASSPVFVPATRAGTSSSKSSVWVEIEWKLTNTCAGSATLSPSRWSTIHGLPRTLGLQRTAGCVSTHSSPQNCLYVGSRRATKLLTFVVSSNLVARCSKNKADMLWIGPLVSSNITGDLLVTPEHRMSLKFVVWI